MCVYCAYHKLLGPLFDRHCGQIVRDSPIGGRGRRIDGVVGCSVLTSEPCDGSSLELCRAVLAKSLISSLSRIVIGPLEAAHSSLCILPRTYLVKSYSIYHPFVDFIIHIMEGEPTPIDVETQCGVPLPNGGFCARSLACKRHSMASKRAVTGRSAPYDQLLAQYQTQRRSNQTEASSLA